MIGRGALAVPNLAHVIKGTQSKMQWHEILKLLLQYSNYEVVNEKQKYYPARLKQWLKFIAKQYSEADELFNQVRVLKKTPEILSLLRNITNA